MSLGGTDRAWCLLEGQVKHAPWVCLRPADDRLLIQFPQSEELASRPLHVETGPARSGQRVT